MKKFPLGMNKVIKEWFKQANYDFDTAQAMFDSKRYVYAIFMCHLAVEKALKALVIFETQKLSPKTHDLIKLFKISKVDLSDDLRDFIGILNNAAIVTRYPEDLKKIVSSYPKSETKKYLAKTQEIIRCIQKDQRLQR